MPDTQVTLRRWKRLAVVQALALMVALALLVLAHGPETVTFTSEDFRGLEIDRSDRLKIESESFDSLQGWKQDSVSVVLPALRKSCGVFLSRDPEKPVGKTDLGGRSGDWRGVCSELQQLGPLSGDDELRAWFEGSFNLWKVTNRGRPKGLFTGYYEASLQGSRRRHPPYIFPLYRRPPELTSIDLGRFREDLAGRQITGKVAGSTFVPFADRGEIDGGALAARRLELVWVDDAVDAFFLHIQGSGRVQLEDGRELRVGYGGQNGYPYFAIGRELIDRGAIPREKMSMQAIREWLEANPEEVTSILEMNLSYVFFKELEGEGPLGSMGVALTAGRSLAIDASVLPMGVPIWLDSSQPMAFEDAEVPLQRLMVAQDTGGAIKGVVRGDVFWGHGDEAAEVAGRMKQEGSLFLLLPQDMKIPQQYLGISRSET